VKSVGTRDRNGCQKQGDRNQNDQSNRSPKRRRQEWSGQREHKRATDLFAEGEATKDELGGKCFWEGES